MIWETGITTVQYGSPGHGFGGRLANAAPDLSTSVSRPGAEPTCNAAERALRRTARGTYGRGCAPQAG